MLNLDPKAPSTDQVDSLLAEWKIDAVMDKLEPASELRKIGSLHSKYLTILSTHRRAFKEGERRMAKLRRLKYEYYMGRLDQTTLAHYKWEPFLYTLKGDLATYMDSDKELVNGKAVIAIHEEIVDLCERIIKELGSRTFQLKDIISWEKFISGAH
jgi:hypothetical protein